MYYWLKKSFILTDKVIRNQFDSNRPNNIVQNLFVGSYYHIEDNVNYAFQFVNLDCQIADFYEAWKR